MDTEYTLTQQAFLLCYNLDKQNMARAEVLDYLVRAATLVELYLGGHLVDDGGRAAPARGARPADRVLGEVLGEIGQAPNKSWKHWVRLHAKGTKRSVRADLVKLRAVTVDKSRVLGLFPHTTVTVRDVRAVKQAQARMKDALRRPPNQIDPGGAALVALAAAAEIGFLLDRKDRREHRARIDQCTEIAGPAAPALRKLLRQRRSGAIGGAVAGSAAASGG